MYEKQKDEFVKELEDSVAEHKKFLWHSECEKTIMQAKRVSNVSYLYVILT